MGRISTFRERRLSGLGKREPEKNNRKQDANYDPIGVS